MPQSVRKRRFSKPMINRRFCHKKVSQNVPTIRFFTREQDDSRVKTEKTPVEYFTGSGEILFRFSSDKLLRGKIQGETSRLWPGLVDFDLDFPLILPNWSVSSATFPSAQTESGRAGGIAKIKVNPTQVWDVMPHPVDQWIFTKCLPTG